MHGQLGGIPDAPVIASREIAAAGSWQPAPEGSFSVPAAACAAVDPMEARIG